jgi:hypothetical protein
VIWAVHPVWASFVAALIFWLPQNLLHEGAHAMVAKRYGAEITRVWPFPGRMPNGEFAFAHVLWCWTAGTPGTHAQALIAIAPQLSNTLFLIVAVVLMALVGDEMPTLVAAILCGLAITNYIDGAVNLSTFYRQEPPDEKKHTDGWRYQLLSRQTIFMLRMLTSCWQVVFLVILLLPWTARAQEPAVFDPIPFDAQIDGVKYPGILIDEGTYQELGRLRVETKTQKTELQSFEEWKADHEQLMRASLEEMKTTCEEGQTTLTDHYEEALRREQKKDFFQRHGFPLGVAVGVVASTAVYLGAVHLYGEVITTTVE